MLAMIGYRFILLWSSPSAALAQEAEDDAGFLIFFLLFDTRRLLTLQSLEYASRKDISSYVLFSMPVPFFQFLNARVSFLYIIDLGEDIWLLISCLSFCWSFVTIL